MSRPLPPEIYRRRRIVVFAGLIGILIIVWLIVRTLFGGDEEPKTQESQSPSESTASSETTAPAEDAAGTVPVSLEAGTTACDPESVRITPSVADGQSAGGDVDVTLVVSSSSTDACVLEADAAELVVVIDNGTDPVYDSTACTTSILSEPVSLSPEWATVATATWSGRVSGTNCSDTEAYVSAGTYTIKLGTLGGEPGEASFELAAAPEPEPTPTDEPEPTATADPSATPEPTTEPTTGPTAEPTEEPAQTEPTPAA